MEGKRVSVHSKNPAGDLPGIMYGDPQANPRGLVLLHAWWGLDDVVKAHAAQIAEEGFTVMVPDIYRGKLAKDRETAGHYMADLDWLGAAKDVAGAAKYLKANGCRKVGVAGFCMGGALSFLCAAIVPEVDAAAPFYGISQHNLADLTKITIPVQGHFGDKDVVVGLSSPSDFNPLNKKLQAANVPFELNVYPAGHAFAHPISKTYHKESADLAFKRLYEFMKAKL